MSIVETQNFGVVEALEKPEVSVVTTELSRVSTDGFVSQFEQDMNRSVPDDLHSVLLQTFHKAYEESEISMIGMYDLPTHHRELSGAIVCFELGGSTFRAGVVDFSLKNVLKVQESWVLKEEQKVINDHFFEQMVQKCLTVPAVVQLLLENTNIAVTWSFPTDAQGRIITMGKGWKVDERLKKVPLSELIQNTFSKLNISVVVHEVINDSVGTALAGMSHGILPMSLILGTGVNVCLNKNGKLLNTELGFFGGLAHPTKYDLLVDERWLSFKDAWKENSDERIFQPFELITGGRNVCELLRIVLCDMDQSDVSFSHIGFDQFDLPGELFCLFSSAKCADTVQKEVLSQFSLSFEQDQIEAIQRVVRSIITRSSRYVKTALMAMHEFSTGQTPTLETPIKVTYTGSFLQHCELYQQQITKDSGFELCFVADSSLIGAAVATSL